MWVVQFIPREKYDYPGVSRKWGPWSYKFSEQEAQVEMVKLALKYGGQWRIVKEE